MPDLNREPRTTIVTPDGTQQINVIIQSGTTSGQGRPYVPSYWAGFCLSFVLLGGGFLVIQDYGRFAAWFLGGFAGSVAAIVLLTLTMPPDTAAGATVLGLLGLWTCSILDYRNRYAEFAVAPDAHHGARP